MCQDKKRYDNEKQAKRALRKVRIARRAGLKQRRESRPYYCEYCKGYHLTSKNYYI